MWHSTFILFLHFCFHLLRHFHGDFGMFSGYRSRPTFLYLLSLLLTRPLKAQNYQLVFHDVAMKCKFLQEILKTYVKWLPEKLCDNDRGPFKT